MKIDDYQTNEDGDILFPVDEKLYSLVVRHLGSKGISSSNSDLVTGSVELCVGVSIEELNQALADFHP